MYKATKLLSSSSLPTQRDLRLTFLGTLASLQHCKQQSNQSNVIDAIYNKLETYWNQHLSDSSSISAILDPRYKTTTFTNSVERNNCVNNLQNLFSLYVTNSLTIPNRTREVTSQNSRNYFLNIINNNQHFSTENLEFDELNNYLHTPNDINIDPVMWWKEHQDEYPVLSLIAKDYLIIQATSVAAEQAFSVAGNTISQTRNKLDPDTAKAILCLKSWIENGLGIINVNNENNEANGDDNSNSNSNYSDDDYSDNNSSSNTSSDSD
jgi:hypothetical protein